MRRSVRVGSWVVVAVALGGTWACGAPELPEGAEPITLQVGERTREAVLYSAGLDDATLAPLVVVFHGGGGTAAAALDACRWHEVAQAHGFRLELPEGSRRRPNRPASFLANPQVWNDGSGRWHAGEDDVDDVGFVAALLDHVSARWAVDPQRVYATGFSNGAAMTWRVGAELSERFAAVAPIGGAMRGQFAQPTLPLPLLGIWGADDPINMLEGGRRRGGEEVPAAAPSYAQWAAWVGAEEAWESSEHAPGVERRVHRGGSVDVEWYVVEGLGHVYPGGRTRLPERLVGSASDALDGNALIWSFFAAHPRAAE